MPPMTGDIWATLEQAWTEILDFLAKILSPDLDLPPLDDLSADTWIREIIAAEVLVDFRAPDVEVLDGLVLIGGDTHRPGWASLSHLDQLYMQCYGLRGNPPR